MPDLLMDLQITVLHTSCFQTKAQLVLHTLATAWQRFADHDNFWCGWLHVALPPGFAEKMYTACSSLFSGCQVVVVKSFLNLVDFPRPRSQRARTHKRTCSLVGLNLPPDSFLRNPNPKV